MAKALLIAEKPDLMKHVAGAYRQFGHKDIIVFKSFAGHTMTLKEPDEYKPEWKKWDMALLPMIPDKFLYKPSKDKVKMYQELKKEIETGDYDYLINCCDPGREGQHIFFSFYDAIGCKLPVKRMWHRDLTDKELSRALNNLRDENEPALRNMTIASKYRAFFDWLIGLNGTRAVSITANKKINIGRVMTPILKIIADREVELTNFVPKDFWEIQGDFGKFAGIYFDDKNENETRFFDKSKAEALVKTLGKDATIISVDKKKETKYAPGLHSLQELSNEANRTFGYTMAETLALAQSLYEKKILSYPRTDSAFLTTSIADEFPKYLKAIYCIDELKDTVDKVLRDKAVLQSVGKNKKYVDNSKVTDHNAIIPTGEAVDLNKLSEKERNIFYIVCKRFLAIFLPPMVTNKTNIVTEDNGHKFSTVGSVLVDIGYMTLYNSKFNDNILPDVKKGEKVTLSGTKLLQKKTSPPSRYNDETLGKALENSGKFIEDEELSNVLKSTGRGLGTPATRGNIVEKLVSLDMIGRKGSGKVKSFYATEFGISIIEGLRGKDITLPELTATWEQKLTGIEEGTYAPKDFYNEMLSYVKEMITDFKGTKVFVSNTSDKEVLGICPECGKRKVIVGKDFYLCEAYKNGCNFIVGQNMFGAKISKTEVKKIIAGKETKEFEFSKDGKTWKAKLIFDKDQKRVVYAKNGTSGGASKGSSGGSVGEVIGKCPKCGGNVKETASYYLCENYKTGTKPCDCLIPKNYWGADISKADAILMLNGRPTIEKECTWKSGKKSKVILRYTTKVEHEFSNNK